MADGKFLETSASGLTVENQANQTSAGAGDADKLIRLDATGRLDTSFMPVGIGADTQSVLTSEDLSAGDFVNLYDNAGTLNARKADASAASAGKAVSGFVLAGTTTGQNANVYFEGINNQVAGLTPGTRMFLSNVTPGGSISTAVDTSGHTLQVVGEAISATAISFERSEPIVRV